MSREYSESQSAYDAGWGVQTEEEPKTEQCFCPSCYDDDNVLQDCTCGKCEPTPPHQVGCEIRYSPLQSLKDK